MSYMLVNFWERMYDHVQPSSIKPTSDTFPTLPLRLLFHQSADVCGCFLSTGTLYANSLKARMDLLVVLPNVFAEVRTYTRYVVPIPVNRSSTMWPGWNLLKIAHGGTANLQVKNIGVFFCLFVCAEKFQPYQFFGWEEAMLDFMCGTIWKSFERTACFT